MCYGWLMFFLTSDECTEFCASQGWSVDLQRRYPVLPPAGFEAIRFMVPPARDRLTAFCRLLVDLVPVGVTDAFLLWAMHWHDWGSTTNTHLYYRLRQSYADLRQLYQAPGHAFLGHEIPDAVSFVELALLFGWDFHLLSSFGDWGVYHDDELLIIYSSEAVLMDIAKASVTEFGLEWREHGPKPPSEA